jgi:hypothetical protein
LRQYAEHEPDAFDRLLLPTTFDYEHSRRVRSQHLFEACASPLPPELAHWKTETGGPGGSQRPIRFGGRSRVGARRLVSRAPDTYRTSDIPVAAPWPRLACATRENRRTGLDRALQALREDPPATTIRDAFHRQPPAPCAGRTHNRKRSREVSAPLGCRCCFTRGYVLSYVGPRARRPSLNASRSGEMESVRFSAPATVCRLLQHSPTREHDLERPILARAGGRAL